MSRSTLTLIVILILAFVFFGSVFNTCSPGVAHSGGLGGIIPIFVGGGGWDRGGWNRSSPPSSSPSSPSRSTGGTLRGGGITGGRGGK